MNSINISGSSIGVYGKKDEDGNIRTNAYRVSGRMNVTIGAVMTAIPLTINGTPINATVKVNEQGQPKQNDKGNYGWRLNAKLIVGDVHHQCNLHLTPIKMPGILPINGTYTVMVTGDITGYTPTKAAPAAPQTSANGKKGKKPAPVAEQHPQSVSSQPMSEDDAFMAEVRRLLAGK